MPPLSNGWTKRILRDSLKDVLPKAVRTRKSKLGFSTPESKWLADPLADWLRETLSSPRNLADVVDLRGVRELLDKRLAGDRSLPVEKMLLRLAIYESWARQFLSSGVNSGRGPYWENMPLQLR